MSIYFALEYDENGVSRIVEKKDTSTRAITQRDFNFGSYVGNQITSPEDPNQPVEDNTMDDFISQMGTGTMQSRDEIDSFQNFIDRSNLRGFMDTGPKDTKFINALFAAAGIPVTAEGITKFFDNISKFLPQESAQVKAIRRFYATEGLRYMNPNSPDYIPGMENYNIVYGGFPGIKDPSIGLQDALTRRSDNIIDTLKGKYGFNDIEIKQIQMGTYSGTKGYNEIMGKQTNLIDLLTNITQFKKIEKDYIDNIPTDEVATTGGVDKIDFTSIDYGDSPEGEFGTGSGSNVPPGIVEDTEGGGEFSTPQRQRDLSGSDKKDFGPYQDRAKAASETRSRDLGSMRGGVGRNNPGTSNQGFTDSGKFAGL
jgi:hypothetical protein